jgi:outer membrane lipase/esterase
MSRKTILATLAASAGFALAGASAAEAACAVAKPAYDDVVVFGDSLSDVGNVFTASTVAGDPTPGAPYYQGRYSNGQLWVEHVAGAYCVTLTPSLSGGNDWAYADAETTEDVGVTIGETAATIPSLVNQSKTYLATVNHKADPKALYVIWGGGNDVKASLLGQNNTPSAKALPAIFATKTAGIVQRLKAAGARHFLVAGVPDVGLTPDATSLGATASGEATALSKALNAAIAVALADPGLLAGVQIYQVNTSKLMGVIVDGDTNFNFTSTEGVTLPCITGVGSTVCSDPDHTFFWDGFHPTAFGHAYIAIEAMKVLPTN